ncbi:MAG: flagellar FlbD family protein [Candidatus Cloacimonadota bacterium]|nr:flagellar FlbD family protein [Candidatus Cloacimonadota bacterium]
MVKITKFNGKEILVNSDLIEFIEATPDTIITLTTGKKVIVKDKVEDLVERIVKFKKKIYELPEIIKKNN